MVAMLIPIRLDGKPLGGQRVGHGRTGQIIRTGDTVTKMVINFDISALPRGVRSDLKLLRDQSRSAIENEKRVLSRLGNHSGIVQWTNTSKVGIEMRYMEKGDLQKYMRQHRPDRNLQNRWIQQLADTVSYIHSKDVFIGDIASRNVLVDDDLSLVLCDFGDSRIMLPSLDKRLVDDRGFSIKLDIASFGSLIYEIVTGVEHKFVVRQRTRDEVEEDWGPKLSPKDRSTDEASLEDASSEDASSEDASSEDKNSEDESDDARSDSCDSFGEDNDGEDGLMDGPQIEMETMWWPLSEDLPDVTNIQFGEIIQQCWKKAGYQSIVEVCQAIAATRFVDTQNTVQPLELVRANRGP